MIPINSYINEIVSPLMKKKGINHGKIFLDWCNIVGDRIASFSWPQKVVKKSEDEGFLLYLEVSNSSFATELKYLEDLLIEKISVYFGYKAISQIKIKINLGPNVKNKIVRNNVLLKDIDPVLEKSLSYIEEEALKNALKSLLIFSKNQNKLD